MILILRPARMCKLDCIVAEDKKSRLMKQLHQAGVAQIEHLDDSYLEDLEVERDRPMQRAADISGLLLRVRKVLDSLSVFETSEVNFIEDILEVEAVEKTEVERKDFQEIVKETEELLNKTEEQVEECEENLKEVDPKGLLDRIQRYEKFSQFDIRVEDLGESDFLYLVLGSVPDTQLKPLKDKLKEKFDGRFILTTGARMEDRTAASVCVHKEDREELDRVLKDSQFERAKIEGEGKIEDILKKLKDRLKEAKKTKKENRNKLKDLYKKYYQPLLITEEELSIMKERYEIFVSCGRTERTVVLRLWVPQEDFPEVERLIKEETEDLSVIKVDREPEKAPILLDNPKIMKPFESLTRLFALPKYNEIDPTMLIAPTFCLFFGIMLTDTVYGILLFIGGLFVRKAFGRYSNLANAGGFVAMGCGIASTFFGLLTGSYLGDFLGKYLLGKSSQYVALWLDPLNNGNAITFLLMVVVIGFIHVFAGYFFGAFDSWRRGEKMKALTEYIAWFILAGGIGMAALTYVPGGGLLPKIFLYPGIAVAGLGLILLLKGAGLMVLIDMVGVVGDTLSYARLLAMALTTAGIALSFNFLAQMMLGIPYVGIVIAGVIFAAGHLINIIINSLGAFVHSLRLQYVEHFGTYYEGGGAEFKPFKEKRTYTIPYTK